MVDQFIQGEEDVSAWVSKSRTVSSVMRLPGDASTRSYYRIGIQASAGARGETTRILMRTDPFADQGENMPFLSVRNHLAENGVDVPEVIDVDAERGFVLLEDLGDVTLLRRLQEVASADVERHLYEQAIDQLVDLQAHASAPKKGSPQLDAFRLRFDEEKLLWEVNFTIEHFYELYLKRQIKASDMKVIRDGFAEICATLAKEPVVLAHRDYHSRNIMVTAPGGGTDERMVMIDFQDARMGPRQYDLASLLKDSYYQLEESQIQRLLDYYVSRWEAVSAERLNGEWFRYVFDLMSIQRNFKAIGSFASFLNRRGNATYLKFIGNTFENIRRALLKYPLYSSLREVLFHYYYF